MAQFLSSVLGSLSIDTQRPPPRTSPISGPRGELKGRQVVDAPDLPGNCLPPFASQPLRLASTTFFLKNNENPTNKVKPLGPSLLIPESPQTTIPGLV